MTACARCQKRKIRVSAPMADDDCFCFSIRFDPINSSSATELLPSVGVANEPTWIALKEFLSVTFPESKPAYY